MWFKVKQKSNQEKSTPRWPEDLKKIVLMRKDIRSFYKETNYKKNQMQILEKEPLTQNSSSNKNMFQKEK